MDNPAWADDPDLRVAEMDDVDSRRLIKGLRIIFWPWPTLLIVLWTAAIIFDLAFLSGPLLFGTMLWLTAHLLFRTKKFLSELRAFGEAVADQLSKLMAKLNRAAKKRDSAEPAAAKSAPQMREAPAPESAPVRPEPSEPIAKPRAPIDWGKAFGWLLNPRVLIAIFVLLLLIGAWRAFDAINPFREPSGREVAAEARADVADAKQATSDAESAQARAAIERLENAASRYERLSREAERARHAIQNAPDLDGGIIEHRAYVDGVRRDAADARASAVHDYRSAIDP